MTAFTRRPAAPVLVRLALGASLIGLIAGAAQAQSEGATQQGVPGADTAATSTAAEASQNSTQSTTTGESIDTNTIVVIGYKRSVEDALRVRRDSISIVDSLSAEDVGKLPDVSIADALSRLPGVAVQTADGRGEFISIRGFSGDFTGALLNGREIATIDDNRRFDYSILPGDLFNRVDVIKTASADLMATGLAGTVNLLTIDPLSNKRIFSVSAQGELNDFKSLNPDLTNKGYKFSGIFVDHFADDTLGISLGASAIESPVQNKQYDAWGYAGPDAEGNYQLGGAKWFADTNVLYRQTGFGHIVYKPSDKFEISLDGLYSHYKYREYQRGLEVPLSWGAGTVETAHTGADGFEQTATYDNVYAVQRNNYNTRNAYTMAFGGNLQYHFNDRLHLSVDGSYSKAHRKDNAYETYTGTGYNKSGEADTVNITRQPSGVYSLDTSLDYTDTSKFQLTDPQGWGFYQPIGSVVQAGYDNVPKFTDIIKSLRASLTEDLGSGFLKNIEVGANYQVRTKINGFTGYYLVPPAGSTEIPVPSSAIIGSVNPGYTDFPTLAYNVPDAISALTGSFRNETSTELALQWRVEEKVLTGYAQLNFDGLVGGLDLAGNIGAQFVHTEQSSIGHAQSSGSVGTFNTVSASDSYNAFLPSVNLRLALSNSADIHLGASRTLSRAPMSYQNASFQPAYLNPGANADPVIAPNGKISLLSGTGGNPILRPYYSNNVDIGVERFFAQGQGIIAANYFFKAVSNFVNPNNYYFTDLSQFSDLVPAAMLSDPRYTTVGYITGPVNDGRGFATGFELQATVPFGMFSHALDGFGVRGSGSWTNSSIRYTPTPVPGGIPVQFGKVTLPGLSKWVANAQVYFEKWGFNARVSYQYRSDFLSQYLAFGAQPTFLQTKGRSTVDAQIGYDFKSGLLNGLSIYLQGHNLTNSPYVTYNQGHPDQILNYEKYGATYLAGVTMKF